MLVKFRSGDGGGYGGFACRERNKVGSWSCVTIKTEMHE